jgi:hypothetical protein
MKRLMCLFVVTCAGWLLTAAPGRADLISYQYQWSVTPSAVSAGASSITFSAEPSHSAVGSSNIVVTDMDTLSTASSNHPDTFATTGGRYNLALRLTDTLSHVSGMATFTGQIQGSLSQSNVIVHNTFDSPTAQLLTLGDNIYVVSLTSFTSPGLPGATNHGSIGSHVDVFSAHQHAPEPSTMLLAGLGLGLAGMAGWRRRRAGR